MADWAKIALKTGLVAGIMAAIWAVFVVVPVPAGSTVFGWFDTLNFGFKFLAYWVPGFTFIWPATLALISIYISLWTFRMGSIALRWLFKVNE